MKELTDREWEKFFELMSKIVSRGGAWFEKAEEVKVQAKEAGCETEFEEFTGWFQDTST